MDRIKALRLFTRVVDLGSFSRAALELGIGQPAATKQVARMEQELGARLLHRSTHGVSPTDVGIRYYEKCKLIVHHDEEARSVAALTQSRFRTLRISTSVAFGRRVLAPMVLDFMRDHALLTVDLSFDDRYVNLVEQGVDVAVRMGRLADSRWARPTWATAPGSWSRRAPTWNGAARPPARSAGRSRGAGLQHRAGRRHLAFRRRRRADPGHSGEGTAALEQPVRAAGRRPRRFRHRRAAALCGRRRPAPRAILPLLEDWRLPGQEIHAVYPSPRMVLGQGAGTGRVAEGQVQGRVVARGRARRHEP